MIEKFAQILRDGSREMLVFGTRSKNGNHTEKIEKVIAYSGERVNEEETTALFKGMLQTNQRQQTLL
jgi:hypothetical protein